MLLKRLEKTMIEMNCLRRNMVSGGMDRIEVLADHSLIKLKIKQ